MASLKPARPTVGSHGTEVAVGVVGNSLYSDRSFTKKYDDRIRASSNMCKEAIATCRTISKRKQANPGWCSPKTKGSDLAHTRSTVPMNVDFTKLSPNDQFPDELWCLHKRWGAASHSEASRKGSPTWWSGGVRREMVYMAERETGDDGEKATVLCLRIQGDQASSTDGKHVMGLGPEKKYNSLPCETCSHYPSDDDSAQRVGGVVTTSSLFASGRYEVVARVPPGNDYEHEGMGYVFAMWPFAYTENYPLVNGKVSTDPQRQTLDGTYLDNGDVIDPKSSPETVYRQDVSFTCSNQSRNCIVNEGAYTVINHEIDIEIPSNAWRLPRETFDAANGTWSRVNPSPSSNYRDSKEGVWCSNTINFNTWLGDDGAYNDGSPYTNVGVHTRGDSLISRRDSEFRTYAIEWHTGDDSKGIKPHVKFFVDGKHLQTISNRYVPTRAGRLYLGPWFGWWGGIPNFDTREVWIKSITIQPFNEPNDVDMIQLYDQCGESKKENLCFFKDLNTNCQPTVCSQEKMACLKVVVPFDPSHDPSPAHNFRNFSKTMSAPIVTWTPEKEKINAAILGSSGGSLLLIVTGIVLIVVYHKKATTRTDEPPTSGVRRKFYPYFPPHPEHRGLVASTILVFVLAGACVTLAVMFAIDNREPFGYTIAANMLDAGSTFPPTIPKSDPRASKPKTKPFFQLINSSPI